jgi:hypothetical protein
MARIGWDVVPLEVRRAIAAEAGGEVVAVGEVDGGFSPCLAARLGLADGRSVFVKAVSSAQNPDSPDFVRRELAVLAAMPAVLPVPRLLASIDDGEWVVAISECVEGRLPRQPWVAAELESAFSAVAALGGTVAPPHLPSAAERFTPLFDGWRSLVAADAVPPEWSGRVDELQALEEHALDAVAGDRLVHADIRADNLLVTAKGEVVIVDWAHACRGASWLDVVLWAPPLVLEGGVGPVAALEAVGALPSSDDLLAVVAGLAGYFLHRGGLPAPPGLPTLRPFQLAQSIPALDWLDRLFSRQ